MTLSDVIATNENSRIWKNVCIYMVEYIYCVTPQLIEVTVNPLLSHSGGSFISSTVEGGLNRERGLI